MATLAPPIQDRKADETALITGSEAIAVACKLADVDVITAYPIRPYDTVMQYVAKLVANGELDCEYIVAEGEHSQFEIVKHASACGARVFCGSSGVGWKSHLHVSLTAIQGVFTFFIALETWLVPFEGYLVDRIGPRLMLGIGAILVGL